jgi:hypothetical protein
MILKLKTTDEINECIKAQSNFCEEKNTTLFTPGSGYCYRCHKNIYQNVGWKDIAYLTRERVESNGDEVDRITGISLEKAGGELITGCPHCNYSFCD